MDYVPAMYAQEEEDNHDQTTQREDRVQPHGLKEGHLPYVK